MKRQPRSGKRLFLFNFIAALIDFSLHDDGDTALQSLAGVLKRKIVNYCFSPRQQRGVFIGRMRQEEEGVVLAGWVVALLSTSIYQ